jgi:hypothetical protein
MANGDDIPDDARDVHDARYNNDNAGDNNDDNDVPGPKTWKDALKVCGLTEVEINTFMEVGDIRDCQDLVDLEEDEVENLARQICKKNPTAKKNEDPNYSISIKATSNLKLLHSEIKLRHQLNRPMNGIYEMDKMDLVLFRSRKKQMAAFKDSDSDALKQQRLPRPG